MNAVSLSEIRHKPARYYNHTSRSTSALDNCYPTKGKTLTEGLNASKMSRPESEVTSMNDEQLLKQYSCAWLKDGSIFVHGRVSITSFHIYFHSNILGWETKLLIDFKDVTDITKQKTARVFSNAITVTTREREYFLSSFLHRNNAFRVLQLVWRHSKKGIALTKDQLSQLIKEQQQQLKQPSRGSPVTGPPDDDNETDGLHKRSHSLHVDSSTTASSGSTHSGSADDDYSSQQSETTLTEKPSDDSETSNDSSTSSSILQRTITPGNVVEESLRQERRLAEDGATMSPLIGIRGIVHKVDPAQVVNGIILTLIVLLLISMLSIICKLCELDPNLRSWLLWQPWCRFVCSYQSE